MSQAPPTLQNCKQRALLHMLIIGPRRASPSSVRTPPTPPAASAGDAASRSVLLRSLQRLERPRATRVTFRRCDGQIVPTTTQLDEHDTTPAQAVACSPAPGYARCFSLARPPQCASDTNGHLSHLYISLAWAPQPQRQLSRPPPPRPLGTVNGCCYILA